MPNSFCVESSCEDGTSYDPTAMPSVLPKSIGPGQYLSLNLQPLLDIFNAGKYLPTRYASLQLEFTLANPNEAVHPLSGSSTHIVKQAQMRYAVVVLDSAVANSFSSLLMQGRAITIPIRTLHLQQAALPQGNTEAQISMVRALSRLAGFFITFVGPETYIDSTGATVQTAASRHALPKVS